MSKNLVNPLQNLIAQAGRVPRETGEARRYQARYRPGGPRVVLCDVSGSMDTLEGGATRHAHLRNALSVVCDPADVLIAFATVPTRISSAGDLPTPGGGTHLEAALDAAAACSPTSTLVISDGEPTLPAFALLAAGRLGGRIDVIFCGDENNATAITFMRELAHLGTGRCTVHSWQTERARPIAHTIRQMLVGPNAGVS